jgi:hypothetical protein
MQFVLAAFSLSCYCLLLLNMFFMYLTSLSHARSFRLSGRWSKLLLRHVRSITIVSVLSKGFERLINGQILAHVDRSVLLSEFQSGFRCDHSTTTALVRVIEVLRSCWTFRRRLIVWTITIIYLCTSMSRRFIFMARLGIWRPHF